MKTKLWIIGVLVVSVAFLGGCGGDGDDDDDAAAEPEVDVTGTWVGTLDGSFNLVLDLVVKNSPSPGGQVANRTYQKAGQQ